MDASNMFCFYHLMADQIDFRKYFILTDVTQVHYRVAISSEWSKYQRTNVWMEAPISANKCYGFLVVDFKTFWKWNENEELMHWWSADHCNATYVICIHSHFLFFCLENLISSCPRIFSLSSKANFTASPLREHFNAGQDNPQILTGQDEKSF